VLQRGKDEFEKSESEIARKEPVFALPNIDQRFKWSYYVLRAMASGVTSQLRCIKWSSFFVVSKVDPSFVGAKGRLSFLFLPSW